MNFFNTLRSKILFSQIIIFSLFLGLSLYSISSLFIKEKKIDIFELGLTKSKLILSELEAKYKTARTLQLSKASAEDIPDLRKVYDCSKIKQDRSKNICDLQNSFSIDGNLFYVTLSHLGKTVSYEFELSQELISNIESKNFHYYLFDYNQKKIINSNYQDDLYKSVLNLGQDNLNLTKEIKEGNNNWLAVRVRSLTLPWQIVLLYDGERVFSSLYDVTNQILAISLLVFGLIIIFSVLISNYIATPIELLTDLAHEIKAGNFGQRFTRKVYGEFTELAETFNSMAEKIIFFLQEMKQKTRLEGEVKIAQLVQSSFFPIKSYEDEKIDLHGFYHSASECGGDWWTFKRNGPFLFFALGDATGHGVAPSLITASVHSYSSILERLMNEFGTEFLKPARVLNYFNDILMGAGGNLNMTMFVGCLNLDTHELTYANASHEPPFYLTSDIKSELKYMKGLSGPRLGEMKSAEYEEFQIQLQPKSNLVIYSDGYIEGINEQEAQWGQRRFINTLLSHFHSPSAQKMTDEINLAFDSFKGQAPLNDDLSLMVIKIK